MPSRVRSKSAALLAVIVGMIATMLSAGSATAASVTATATATVRSHDCGDGVTAWAVDPPNGFDAVTATDDQLRAVDLPPRPSDPAILGIWTRFVTSPIQHHLNCPTGHRSAHASQQPPPSRSTAVGPNAAGNTSYNPETDAEAYWVVHAAPSGSQDVPTYSSSWVGIDGGDLMQAGSDSDGASPPQLWYEVYDPQQQRDVANSVLANVNSGDTAFVHVTVGSGSATFHVEDLTQLEDWHLTVPGLGSKASAGGAQWILERPEVGSNYPRLAKVSVTFTTAQAAGPYNGWTGINSLSRTTTKMRDCTQVGGATLATAGSAVGSDQFSASWVGYGTTYPFSTCQ